MTGVSLIDCIETTILGSKAGQAQTTRLEMCKKGLNNASLAPTKTSNTPAEMPLLETLVFSWPPAWSITCELDTVLVFVDSLVEDINATAYVTSCDA